MKVLWASPRAAVGAVELGLVEGAAALAARGHEQHVVLPGPGPLRDLLDGVATVHEVPHNPWFRAGFVATARWTAYNALVGVRQMKALMRRVAPDAVISETALLPTPGFAAHGLGIPHLWHVHGLPTPRHPAVSFVFGHRPTMYAIKRLGDRVLCVSDSVRNDLADWIPPDRLDVVSWAADVPVIETPARREGEPLRMIVLGYKTPGKGQHEAIGALALLGRRGVDARLDLVGSTRPGYMEQLERLVDVLGVTERVRFIDHRDDGLSLLAHADVVLLCSRHDAFPRVTIEAMKVGTPVVAARDYGLNDQIEHGRTGLLYTPGDAADLADNIERLAQEPDLGDSLVAAARAWACERFSSRRYGDLLELSLHSVVGARSAR